MRALAWFVISAITVSTVASLLADHSFVIGILDLGRSKAALEQTWCMTVAFSLGVLLSIYLTGWNVP